MYRQLPHSIEYKVPDIQRNMINAFMLQILAQFRPHINSKLCFNPNVPFKLHFKVDDIEPEVIQKQLDFETTQFMQFIATEYPKYIQRRGLALKRGWSAIENKEDKVYSIQRVSQLIELQQ